MGRLMEYGKQGQPQMNEYVHDAGDQDIQGLIVECTGGEKDSATTKYTLSTLNMLRKIADFDSGDAQDVEDIAGANNSTLSIPHLGVPTQAPPSSESQSHGKKISLSYTINLNLPASKDIEVFNAIFKSLKEHILGN